MSKRVHVFGSAFNMIGGRVVRTMLLTRPGLIGVLGWLLRFVRLMLVPKSIAQATSK